MIRVREIANATEGESEAVRLRVWQSLRTHNMTKAIAGMAAARACFLMRLFKSQQESLAHGLRLERGATASLKGKRRLLCTNRVIRVQ